MKNLNIIMLILFTSIAQCQVTANIITETDFNNIKINNVSFLSIKNTSGNQNAFNNLFSKTITETNIDIDEDYSDYTFNGFSIAFSENNISAFKITNNEWSVNIKGNTITIGSDISILGNVIFNNDTDGSKSIIYQYCDGCDNFIYIDFNQTTNKITEIGFIEET